MSDDRREALHLHSGHRLSRNSDSKSHLALVRDLPVRPSRQEAGDSPVEDSPTQALGRGILEEVA